MEKNNPIRLTDREIKALAEAASPVLLDAYSSGEGGVWDLQRAMNKIYRSQWGSLTKRARRRGDSPRQNSESTPEANSVSGDKSSEAPRG